jgi:hypothetical protein
MPCSKIYEEWFVRIVVGIDKNAYVPTIPVFVHFIIRDGDDDDNDDDSKPRGLLIIKNKDKRIELLTLVLCDRCYMSNISLVTEVT